jgi:hypothetical protein
MGRTRTLSSMLTAVGPIYIKHDEQYVVARCRCGAELEVSMAEFNTYVLACSTECLEAFTLVPRAATNNWIVFSKTSLHGFKQIKCNLCQVVKKVHVRDIPDLKPHMCMKRPRNASDHWMIKSRLGNRFLVNCSLCNEEQAISLHMLLKGICKCMKS